MTTTYAMTKLRTRQRIVGLTIVPTLLALFLLVVIRHSAAEDKSSSLSFLVPFTLPSVSTIYTAVAQSSPRDAAANTTLGVSRKPDGISFMFFAPFML